MKASKICTHPHNQNYLNTLNFFLTSLYILPLLTSDWLVLMITVATVTNIQGLASNHRLSPLWVRVPQVTILRTCPSVTLAVEQDVKPQL